MKKVVNGRLYDTGEAVAVVSWSETSYVAGIPVDVKYTLCRKKTPNGDPLKTLKVGSWGGVSDWDVEIDVSKGEFFLAVQVGGCCSDLGTIRPLDDDEARRLFEDHSSGYGVETEYEKYFGTKPSTTEYENLKAAFAAGAEAQRKLAEETARKAAEEAAKKAANGDGLEA